MTWLYCQEGLGMAERISKVLSDVSSVIFREFAVQEYERRILKSGKVYPAERNDFKAGERPWQRNVLMSGQKVLCNA